ncbi:MAG: hypothetical protein GX573_14595 [Chloroflexi bacterium]|nr:hypothetical protein [Chloroflexota bacterium]
MSYRRDDDPIVEALNSMVFGIIGFVVGLLAAIGVYSWQKKTDVPRFPSSLEGSFYPQPSGLRRDDVKLVLGAAGVLALIVALLSSSSCSFLLGILGLVAAFVIQGDDERPVVEWPPFDPLPRVRRFKVLLPKGTAWDPEVALRFTEHLLRNTVHLALRIVAEPHIIHWEILDWRTNVSPDQIIRAVTAYYPSAEVVWDEQEPVERAYPFYRYVLFFRQAADFVWPMKSVQDLSRFDPLTAITQSMSALEEGESIIYTLSLSLPAEYAYGVGAHLITVSRIHPLQFMSLDGAQLAVSTMMSGQTRREKYDASDQRVAEQKLSRPLYQCFLSICIDSPSHERVQQLATMDSQVWQFAREPYNGLVWDEEPWPDAIRRIDRREDDIGYHTQAIILRWAKGYSYDSRWQRTRLIHSPEEVAALWHLPHPGFMAREIEWSSGRNVVAPAAATQVRDGAVIGENIHAGKRTSIRLADADRALHTYVVGKTGVGKSTLLHHIIHQDIAAGKGVGVIDPHGKLVRDILRTSIPPEREEDVVLVDFAQTEYPPPLNPFAMSEGVPREVALNHVMGVLKKIYAEDWSRTRMENALYSALVALMYEPHATPRDISRLMVDAEYRTGLLQHVKDPVALEYWWDEYEYLSEAMQAQVREPVLNRIRIFYRNPVVRNMICHPQFIDFRAIMDEGKIFLANLNSDETRSEQANLGAMLMANFQMAAMTRGVSDAGEPRPFYLFVEEVQQFVTSALPVVFSEARKFGLSLTAANQYLGQLRGSTLEAILGNAGATVMFACGADDARALSGYLAPALRPEDLMNFDRFHTAMKMQVDGKTVPTFSIQTLPPLPEPPDANEREARIRQQSIQSYTPWTRGEVEAWLENRYEKQRKRRPQGTVTDFD